MSYVAANLGLLPGGTSSVALSCNDVVVVGLASNGVKTQAVYWDAANGIHALESLDLSSTFDFANDVSLSGTLIFGTSQNSTGATQPVVWTAPAYLPTVLTLPGGAVAGIAYACSSNGSVVAGEVGDNGGAASVTLPQPCVWVNGTPTVLPLPAGYTLGGATNVSFDGSVIVGYALTSGNVWLPVTWTGGPKWAVNVLGTLSGGLVSDAEQIDGAAAASQYGSIVVGYVSNSSKHTFAAMWKAATLTTFAGPVGGSKSLAFGCDATGTFVCGISAGNVAALWVNGAGQLLPPCSGTVSVDQAITMSPDATVIVGSGTNGSHQSVAVKWVWQGAPIPGAGGPPTQGGGSGPPTPIFPVRFFLCQPTDWTLTQPVQTVYGLDHLAGMYVIGLADGVLVGPLLVSADGAVTLPFPASAITLGMSFTPQVQTTDLDVGTPTIQGRRKDILAVTARVKSSLGVQVGSNQPDGAALDPPQNAPAWSGMQDVDVPPLAPSYVSPSGQTVLLPITGDLRANVPGDWDIPGQIAVSGVPGLPLYLLAVVPELLEGDVIEQGYSKEPARKERPQKGERSVPGRWMLSSE